MSTSALIILIALAIVALLYLVIIRFAVKARRQHKRKFPAEADHVEQERDL